MIQLILFLFGLTFGSFINALVWRIKNKKDFVNARSLCPHCKHQLQAIDLVPVLSWLSLKGKCRYCKKPVSVQYPLVELATAVLFLVSYAWWPYELTALGWSAFIVWLVALVILVALFIYDLRWYILPNKLVAAVTVPAVLFALLQAIEANKPLDFVVAILSGGLFFGFFWLIFQASKGRWIGGGDVKLAFALGLLVMKPLNVVLVIFLSSVIGSFISIPLLFGKKLTSKTQLPFGPLLIIAVFIVVHFSGQIISWYMVNFLYI